MAAAGAQEGTAGTVYAVVFLILDASLVLGQFAPFLEIFVRAASAYGTIRQMLVECQEPAHCYALETCRSRLDLHGAEVKFENVTFAYPARQESQVLKGLDITLRPGFHAIVGTSGGGKSTLIALLMRLYEYSGSITIKGCELRTLHTSDIRSQIAVLDQDCTLFSETLYDNIALLGLAGRSVPIHEYASRCDRAIADAGVDFLDDLADGVQTRLDNTLRLSGGQRQRVCLARALIADPAILLLDEPTSALDARSEVKVMQAVKAAVAEGVTVIMIAHRLSTVLDADYITVVQDGQVIEQGSPAELTSTATLFSHMLAVHEISPIGISTERESSRPSDGKQDVASETQSDPTSGDPTITDRAESNDLEIGNQLRWFLRLVQPERSLIAAGILASMITGALIVGEAIIFGGLVQLLNTEVDDKRFQQHASFYCLMFLVLACIALLAYVGSGTAFGVSSSKIIARTQAQLLSRTLHNDLSWFSRPGHSATALASRFSKDTSDLACLSGVALGTICTVLVSMSSGITLALAVAWKMAVVLLPAVPVMLASGFVRLRLISESEQRHRAA